MTNITEYSYKANIGLFAVIIAAIGAIFILMQNTRKKVIKNYIVNTYIYILVAILLCSFIIILFDTYQILYDINSMIIIYVFIVMLLVLSAMNLIDKSCIILHHILWVIFIIGIAIIIFPIYNISKHTNILWKSLITVVILVLGLTYLASCLPKKYFKSWGKYLIYCLFGFVVFQVLDVVFIGPSIDRLKIYCVVGLILFSCFLLYDTNKIYEHTDYQQQSLVESESNSIGLIGLFLDIVNQFSNIVVT